MADKNSPEVKKMVDAWLTFAKREGISTPTASGRPAEDKDVTEFIITYLASQTPPIDLNPDQLDAIERVIDKIAPGAPPPVGGNDKNIDALNRIKALIKNKFTDAQKRQLRRELIHG